MSPFLPGEFRRILVIKWSALGDIVIATALFEDIARAFPAAEIHLNTLPAYAGLFEEDTRFARVWTVNVRSRANRLGSSLAWLKQARNGHYDLVIDLQRSDHSRLLLTLWWLSGRAPTVRIGNRGGFPYTHQPAIRRSGSHALPMMQSVLHTLGIDTPTTQPVLRVSPAREQAVTAMRQTHGLADGSYVVLLPGAASAHPLKRWGVAHYAALARLLHQSSVEKIVLIGGPDEVEDCAAIARSGDFVLNLNGTLALNDIPALCAGAAAIIGNDTGTAHFASAAGRPLLVLCGPTDPRRVKPLGQQTVAVQTQLPCSNCYSKTCRNPEHHACMKRITPEWLAHRAHELMRGELTPGQTWREGQRSF